MKPSPFRNGSRAETYAADPPALFFFAAGAGSGSPTPLPEGVGADEPTSTKPFFVFSNHAQPAHMTISETSVYSARPTGSP